MGSSTPSSEWYHYTATGLQKELRAYLDIFVDGLSGKNPGCPDLVAYLARLVENERKDVLIVRRLQNQLANDARTVTLEQRSRNTVMMV